MEIAMALNLTEIFIPVNVKGISPTFRLVKKFNALILRTNILILFPLNFHDGDITTISHIYDT